MGANSCDASAIIAGLDVGNDRCAELFGPRYDMVVNCTPNLPFPDEAAVCRRVPLNDDPFDSVPLFQLMRDSAILDEMREFIRDGKRVLVHCNAGAQRSPAVAACYLVKHQNGMTPQEAIALIRSKRRAAFFWGVTLRSGIERFQAHLRDNSDAQIT